MKLASRKPSTCRKVGFVLPTLLLVTMVLMLMATTLLASGTSSLRVATHDQQADQALYAAEAGLVRASETFAAKGAIASPFQGDLGGSSSAYSVVAYENTGETEMQVPGGPVIPPQTVYLRSEGISENGTRRIEGALFTIGLQAFKVGALGNYVDVRDATFDAYNSGGGDYDPTTAKHDLPLLASNRKAGDTYFFDNADIKGDIFVGPGGDTTGQVKKTNSTVGEVKEMASVIDLEDVEVPKAPERGEDDAEPVDVDSVGDMQLITVDSDGVYHFGDGDKLDFSVDPEKLQAAIAKAKPGDNQDLAKKVSEVLDAPGCNVIYGTDEDGAYLQLNLDDGSSNHWLLLKVNGEAYYSNSGSPIASSVSGANIAAVLFGGGLTSVPSGPPTSVTNPGVLDPGFYDTVTIEDNFQTSLSPEGTYVVKNLIISGDGSQLVLPSNGRNATFYVTGSLQVKGVDALANETRKPPRMKIFYTGKDKVELSGGSRSYCTLVAENADINLESRMPGVRTQFFGALVGNNVTVKNAAFHFDTATSGIGTGTVGSAVSLIHRHRL